MKYVVLYSGGIDSTAVLLLLKAANVKYEIAHFLISPLSTIHAMKVLNMIGEESEVHIWDHRQFLKSVSKESPSLTCLACKRAMLYVVRERGIPVTGDSLGQVASQTLHNLSVIGNAARPLLGSDKEDVDAFLMRVLKDQLKVQLVRKGSVYQCPFKPSKPVVRATPKIRRKVEELVMKFKSTIRYLGMRKPVEMTALG